MTLDSGLMIDRRVRKRQAAGRKPAAWRAARTPRCPIRSPCRRLAGRGDEDHPPERGVAKRHHESANTDGSRITNHESSKRRVNHETIDRNIKYSESASTGDTRVNIAHPDRKTPNLECQDAETRDMSPLT